MLLSSSSLSSINHFQQLISFVKLFIISELKCTEPYFVHSVHTYGMKNSSGASSSTYRNFRSGNLRSRSLDHWLAPFEITSSTSFTPSSPRCSCTRCKRDEKNPTTWREKEMDRERGMPFRDSRFREPRKHSYHIDILNDILKWGMTTKWFKYLSFVQQCVD